jgi:serine/threonine-protein kinase
MKPLNLLPFGRMLQFTNCGPTWNLAGDNKPTRRTSTNKKGTRTLLALALASIVTAGTNNQTCSAQDKLQSQAFAILAKSCQECHQKGASTHHDVEINLNLKDLIGADLVVPGDADNSRLLQVILSGEMPPTLSPPHIVTPTAAEIKILQQWINGLDGETKPESTSDTERSPSDREDSPAVAASIPSMEDLTVSIEAYLNSKPLEKHQFLRFFVFRNIAQVAQDQGLEKRQQMIRSAHIALVKAINSLSWYADFATIETVPNSEDLVLAVDLASMMNSASIRWSEDREWRKILEAYPYAYEIGTPAFKAIQSRTASPIPLIRGDWFITTALQPPLYHDLLNIPEDVKELEASLGIDVEKNILERRVVRSGFNNSKVSPHANRLIERHVSQNGYYWKSYDFLDTDDPKNGKSNIIRFPLGPEFPANPFPELAFTHDGGEVIFSLPNGMQGYMLVDSKGKRINAGPPDLVFDFNQVSGTPLIVNGLSCINCHSEGMIQPPRDEVLPNAQVAGKVRDTLESLHAPGTDPFIQKDREKFVFSLVQMLKPWQEGAKRPQGAEPVGLIAKQFKVSKLRLKEVAAELSVSDEVLQSAIKSNPVIRDLGLKGLLDGGEIKRDDWQKFIGNQTKFHRVLQQLDQGAPYKQIPLAEKK